MKVNSATIRMLGIITELADKTKKGFVSMEKLATTPGRHEDFQGIVYDEGKQIEFPNRRSIGYGVVQSFWPAELTEDEPEPLAAQSYVGNDYQEHDGLTFVVRCVLDHVLPHLEVHIVDCDGPELLVYIAQGTWRVANL